MRLPYVSKIPRAFLARAALAIAAIATAISPNHCCAGLFVDVRATATAEIRPIGSPSTDNGTIGNALASGIRQFSGAADGTSDLFFNVEGPEITSPQFRSFAVADFALPTVADVTSILNATLTLYEAPAAFGVSGPIEVYLLHNTDPNLLSVAANPTAGTPGFQGTNFGSAAIDPAFNVGGLLGSANYVNTGVRGNPTTVDLSFTGANLTALLNAIAAGGTLRLGVTPGNGTVAAPLAGQTFLLDTADPLSTAAPQLEFEAVSSTTNVPEPTSLAVWGLGLGLAVWRVRRRPADCVG